MPLNLGQLLGGNGREMGKVKAQAVGLHQRAGLMDMVAQHASAAPRLQQMGGAVGRGKWPCGAPTSMAAVTVIAHA